MSQQEEVKVVERRTVRVMFCKCPLCGAWHPKKTRGA